MPNGQKEEKMSDKEKINRYCGAVQAADVALENLCWMNEHYGPFDPRTVAQRKYLDHCRTDIRVWEIRIGGINR